MVDVSIAAPERGRNVSPSVSSFLAHDVAARRHRRARSALLARVPASGDTIPIEDALAVVDWYDPAAAIEILSLLGDGQFIADFQDAEAGDRTIVLRRL